MLVHLHMNFFNSKCYRTTQSEDGETSGCKTMDMEEPQIWRTNYKSCTSFWLSGRSVSQPFMLPISFKVIWIFSDAQNTFLDFFLLIQELKCQPGSWISFFVMWIECNTTSKNIYPDFALILTLDCMSWIIAIVSNLIFHSNM